MVPSVADIIRYRYVTRLVLRLVGLILLLFSLVSLIAWLVEGIIGEFFIDYYFIEYYFTSARSCSGVLMFVVGIGLILLAKPLAKAFNPLPRNECPQCGYHLRDLTRPVCPECGLQMPAELLVDERQPLFLDDPTPPGPPTPPVPPTQPTPPAPPGA
jgi:hypothetical protein